jgi:ABC-type transport system involved in multi-copper enzyme maturation permease subunit
MVSLHNILSIAKYERKTLLRSWFFRIFSILSLLVLFGMNFGLVIEGGGSDGWAIRAIPSAIPYFNLLILNVTQAIIAVFLASDFLKRDKKLDTTEVIYMRSMTNGEYVIGKTWGNLQVFMILNVLVVLLALIFNLVAKGTSVSWESYAIYLLAISIPTLIFIMGLSFLLMSIIRNQAITFVLILGYIGITLFLLQAKYYYIFDYMAFNIPMLNSGIVGFGNLETIIIHRGIYLALGIGFIFLTIFLLKRLPQSEVATWFSLVLSLVFIAGGSYLAYTHISNFKQTEKLRSSAIELNNKYVKIKSPSTLAQTIVLEHGEQSISVQSELTLKNETKEQMDQIVFNLNDGLTISELKLNGVETPFLREQHLVIVSNQVQLIPVKKLRLNLPTKEK